MLATHRRTGLDRRLHAEIANKVAHLSHAATLFVPYGVEGFVDLQDGSSSIERVLLPVASNPSPQPAVDAVAGLLRAIGSHAPTLTVLHVGNDEPSIPVFRYPHDRDWVWEWLLRTEDVVEDILATAEQKNADLIAMTTQGHDGFLDSIRGSTTERVLGRVQCPVLAVPAFQLKRVAVNDDAGSVGTLWDGVLRGLRAKPNWAH